MLMQVAVKLLFYRAHRSCIFMLVIHSVCKSKNVSDVSLEREIDRGAPAADTFLDRTVARESMDGLHLERENRTTNTILKNTIKLLYCKCLIKWRHSFRVA